MSCCDCVAVDTLSPPVTPGGGTSPINWQSFQYTATGVEAQQFTVTIPVAQPNANYQVRHMLGVALRAFTVQLVGTSRTINNFAVIVSTNLAAGDIIYFDVFNPP